MPPLRILVSLFLAHATAMGASDLEIAPAPELVTDRPDQTESSVVVPPGYLQLETGAIYSEFEDAQTVEAIGTLMRVGVAPRLELRLGWNGWERSLDENESGHTDAELGFKWYLWPEEDWRPEAALLAWTSLPLGESGHSTERFDPGFRFSFSHTLHSRLSLGYNAGVAWETEEEAPHEDFLPGLYRIGVEQAVGAAVESAVGGGVLLSPVHDRISGWLSAPLLPTLHADHDTVATFEYTVTLGISLTERWGSFIELFGGVPLNASGGPAHSLDGGFTFLLRENIQWDLFGGVGLSDDADDWFVGTGLCFRFPR